MKFLTTVRMFGFSLVFVTSLAGSRVGEVCFPFTDAGVVQGGETSPEITQGRPGRRGPIGNPGFKGDRGASGPPGRCVCDPNEIEQIREEIVDLQDSISQVTRKQQVWELTKVSHCSVGLKDYRIPDDSITASSVYNNGFFAKYARLDMETKPGNRASWLASGRSPGEWIQVDLRTPTFLTGIVTQGRPDLNNGPQYARSYKIAFSNTTSSFQTIQDRNGDKIFQGNHDNRNYATNMFPEPIFCRYVRLMILTWNQHPTVRMEYLTC